MGKKGSQSTSNKKNGQGKEVTNGNKGGKNSKGKGGKREKAGNVKRQDDRKNNDSKNKNGEHKKVCPKLSKVKARCGVRYGRCNTNLAKWAIYCNSQNTWCGGKAKHRDAQKED